MNDDIQAKLRELPSVSVVLDEMADDISQHGHQAVTKAVRAHLSVIREQLQLGEIADVPQTAFCPRFDKRSTV